MGTGTMRVRTTGYPRSFIACLTRLNVKSNAVLYRAQRGISDDVGGGPGQPKRTMRGLSQGAVWTLLEILPFIDMTHIYRPVGTTPIMRLRAHRFW